MWKRKDRMGKKERENIKVEFLKSLHADSERKWKPVIIDNILTEYYISNDGKLASLRMCRLMSPAIGSDGYFGTIISHNGKRINVSIHRIVAIAFIPNPDNKPQINHKDGNKKRNWYGNLEWVTHQENIIHAIETGLRDNCLPNYRYSDKDIHKVCKLLEKNQSISKISSKTSVSKGVIRSVRRGKAWKHISKYYNMPGLIQGNRILDQFSKEQASTTIESDPIIEETFIFDWECK